MSLLFVMYIYLIYSHFTSCKLLSLYHTPGESNFTNPIGRSVVCLSTSRGQVGTCRCRMFTEANLRNCLSSSHLCPAVLDCPKFPPAQISYFAIRMFAEYILHYPFSCVLLSDACLVPSPSCLHLPFSTRHHAHCISFTWLLYSSTVGTLPYHFIN